MKDDVVRLRHVLEAVAKIEHYTAGGREAFFADAMIQDAVIRNLEIIGEAVRNLSAELRRRNPEVPWRSITALRNVLIHEYFGVDLEIVWRLVTRRLPTLKHHVTSLLAGEPSCG